MKFAYRVICGETKMPYTELIDDDSDRKTRLFVMGDSINKRDILAAEVVLDEPSQVKAFAIAQKMFAEQRENALIREDMSIDEQIKIAQDYFAKAKDSQC